MPGKRATVDRKKAVTFHLVHRSQQDPLIADETAPQHVLAEVASDAARRTRYGVYFDDDYAYLQRLRLPEQQQVVWAEAPSTVAPETTGDGERSSETADADCGVEPAFVLPSSLFASHVEESVGLMNRAASDNRPPRSYELDLSGDELECPVVDEEEEGELEDNFVELAGGVASDQESDDGDRVWSSDEGDSADANSDCETGVSLTGSRRTRSARSRMTDYSTATSRGVLSTVAMERLNEQFESMMQEQYDDLDVGALDLHEISGSVAVASQRVLSLADQYCLQQQQELKTKPLSMEADGDVAAEDRVKQHALYGHDSDQEDNVMMTIYEERREDRLDCESILSTYSNTRHLPALIDDTESIVSRPPTSAPVNCRPIRFDSRGCVISDHVSLTKRALRRLDQQLLADMSDGSGDSNDGGDGSLGGASLLSRISLLSVPRPLCETSEQRRKRKHELKDLRRQRRQERKANRLLTGEMLKRQRQSFRDGLAARQTIIYQ